MLLFILNKMYCHANAAGTRETQRDIDRAGHLSKMKTGNNNYTKNPNHDQTRKVGSEDTTLGFWDAVDLGIMEYTINKKKAIAVTVARNNMSARLPHKRPISQSVSLKYSVHVSLPPPPLLAITL